MIPSFCCSLGEKGEDSDSQQPLPKKLNVKYEIQSLSGLATLAHSVLSYSIEKVKYSQKTAIFSGTKSQLY